MAWAAARAVGAAVQQLTRHLLEARAAPQAEASVQAALQLFKVCTDSRSLRDTPPQDQHQHQQQQQQQQHGEAVASLVQQCRDTLQPYADALGWPALQDMFYQTQFEAWSCTVLTVAAGDWLPILQGADRARLAGLIRTTFSTCPAWHALSALMGHLSAVTPRHPVVRGSGMSVTPTAADTAVELLLERFASAHSHGVQQLMTACDAAGARAQGSSSSNNNGSGQQQQQQQQEQQVPAELVQEAAALLAAIPDRVQLLLPVLPDLPHPSSIISSLLAQSVSYLAAAAAAGPPHSSSSSSGGGGGGGARSSHQPGSGGVGPTHLAALLLQKLITRGHANAVAAVVLQLVTRGLLAPHKASLPQQQQEASSSSSSSSSSTACQAAAAAAGDGRDVAAAGAVPQASVVLVVQQMLLLTSSQHAAATEKVLVRLLRLASSSSSQQEQQQQPEPQQALLDLLCPLLAVDAQLRHVTLTRLLLARTLPRSALQLLLRVLASCRPPLLPEAAASLAGAWSDGATVLHMPVPQQAFMTAALVACMEQLPRDFVDPAAVAAAAEAAASAGAQCSSSQALGAVAAAAGVCLSPYPGVQPQQLCSLVPSVLRGVSTRLGSPSPAIRLQAMRAGRAYAAKLDPQQPLFEGAGALGLMPEELWPGAAAGCEDKQRQQQQQQGDEGVVRNGWCPHEADTAAAASGSSSSSVCVALSRLEQAAQGADSDDEEGFEQAAPAAAAAAAAVVAPPAANGTPAQPNRHAAAAAAAANNGSSAGEEGDADSASLAGSEGSAASLVAFDLQEDLGAEEWWGPDGLGPSDGRVVGLRSLAAALRKQDKLDEALDALKRVEVLVRAQPDELPVVAPELARALLHCKVPVWASSPASDQQQPMQQQQTQMQAPPTPQEAPSALPRGVGSNAEVQRARALAAVLALSPLTAGDSIVAELYSPHLDQYQRMLILDSLAGAAAEMADPRKAPRVAVDRPGSAPQLLPPPAGGAAGSRTKAALPSTQQQQQQQLAVAGQEGAAGRSKAVAAAPGMVEASSRVWGKVSLQKQAQAAAAAGGAAASASSGSRTFRNRFAPIALRWASALLQQCDVKQHGIDLFGRDSLLLGRLLTVLGTFVECVAQTPAVVPLSAGLLELLKAQEVSQHNEGYVRRCALVAASQVVRHLPPPRLAGAMVGRQRDPQDAVLVERLQWLLSWAQGVAASDSDQHCRMLAAGCVAWHVELAEGAMAVLEHLPEPEGPDLAGALPARQAGRKGGGRAVAGGGVDVQLPSLNRLVLH